MSMRTLPGVRSLLVFALGLAGAAALPAQTVDVSTDSPRQPADVPFDEAMLHLEHCRWPQAFERLAALADDGHADAARIALLMRVHGTRLFGQSFHVPEARRQRWLDAAAAHRR
jgi:hypothetical protein